MMVHHMVKYYAYIFNIFQKYLGNLFGDFKWGGWADPKFILYVTITVVLSGRSFRDAAEFLFWLSILGVKSCSQSKRIYTDTQYIYEIWEIAIEMSLPQKRNSDSEF